MKWNDQQKSYLICMYAKGVPFESIAEHAKPRRTREEVVAMFNVLATGKEPYDEKINRIFIHTPWTEKEIKLLRWMRKKGTKMYRCAQILCRPKAQVEEQWELILSPVI